MTNKILDLKQRQIDEQAADWLLRSQEGELSDMELGQLTEWLANEAHAEAYRELAIIWSETEPGEPWEYEKAPQATASENQAADFDNAHPAGVKPNHIDSRRSYSKLFAYAASVLLMVGAYLVLQNTAFDNSQQDFQVYETAIEEHQLISLSDGSEIELGAKTAIKISYSDTTRLIDLLKGEAFFEVQKDPARPFIVNTGAGQVRSIGTQFNIHRAQQKVTVAVIEGAVELSRPVRAKASHSSTEATTNIQQKVVLTARQQSSFDPSQDNLTVERANIEQTLSWRKNILVFEEQSLASILEDINRYSKKEIILMDVNKKDLLISGTFIAGELDEWLNGIRKVYQIRVSNLGDDKVLLL